MTDPRLNSVHLDLPRRQQYRQAREALLNARGFQTQALENREGFARSASDPNTVVQNLSRRVPPGIKYLLMDGDYIYPLNVGLNTIGRMPDNDVVVQDAFVSRRHCAILVHAGDGCEIHDTASKNGTYLNGQKLTGPVRLNSGDEIRMCDRQLIFLAQTDRPDEPGQMATLSE
jgi:pSer/pThr/pTyr-binding forkhead associated (FHA) protein